MASLPRLRELQLLPDGFELTPDDIVQTLAPPPQPAEEDVDVVAPSPDPVVPMDVLAPLPIVPTLQLLRLTSIVPHIDDHLRQVRSSKRGKPYRARRPINMPKDALVCHSCGRRDTPEWRRGPDGPATLCNACGLQWAKKAMRNAVDEFQ